MPCQKCGYCPHCGRGGYVQPYWPTTPYPYPWTITVTSGGSNA